MQNPKSAAILSRYNKLKSSRYNWDSHWQELRELVRVNANSFGASDTNGDRRTEKIFDGTAPWALEQLAAALSSSLTSPTDRWINIGLFGIDDGRSGLDDEQLAWLELVTDLLYHEYSNPDVNLYPNLNENYLDLGGLGTTVLYQDYNWEEKHVFFKSFPLADCYIAENARGRIDTLYRNTRMTVRQIKQDFIKRDDRIPAKIAAELDEEKTYTVIHGVYPRTDRTPGFAPKNKAFASCWVVEELKDEPPLRESGFDEFPYHVPRWTKLSGEVYGRAPAMTCLPDIKMINTMSRIVIVAGQKLIDPPLIVPDDGFILPIKTSPGSLIFKTAGQEDTIQPLTTNGRVDIGLELMNQRREQIIKAFYVDMIIRQKKNERQTLGEIQDDRQEMLRQMAPMLGRTQVELLNPMVIRTYNLMNAAGRIPPAPDSLTGERLRVFYVSPAAKAQYGGKATQVAQFMNDINLYANAHPEILDIIDTDVLATELAKWRDISRRVVRSPDVVAKIRDDRQRAAQSQQAAATGKDLGTAAKNFAQAQQALQ
jgi:hypothetical protein